MKLTPGVANGDSKHDTKKVLNLEMKLKHWLEESSIHTVLQWFDTVERLKPPFERGKQGASEVFASCALSMHCLNHAV